MVVFTTFRMMQNAEYIFCYNANNKASDMVVKTLTVTNGLFGTQWGGVRLLILRTRS